MGLAGWRLEAGGDWGDRRGCSGLLRLGEMVGRRGGTGKDSGGDRWSKLGFEEIGRA